MKTTLNLRIDVDLKQFLVGYAKVNRMSITQVITQHLLNLKRHHAKDLQISNLSDESTTKND